MTESISNDTFSAGKVKVGIATKIIVLLSVLICIAVALLIILYGFYNQELHRQVLVNPEKNIVTLSIERGMGVKEIGNLLKEKNLIKYPEILTVYMFLNPSKSLQAGYYRIDLKEKSLEDLISILQKGSFEHKLTFLEGWRYEEYIEYLKEEMGEDFAVDFSNSAKILEGYLFPDTYIIEDGYKPENLVSWMRNNFEKKVTQEMKDEASLRGLSLEDVVILASIVEREMNSKSDRPVVAGILVKRLQNGWPLQADATIQYAKGTSKDWWPIVLRSDYKNFESPYNTYLNKGLPPTPISNPSLSSIKSVIEYKETPYWFYITGNDGKTYYAETLEIHNQNIAQYIK